jgi:transposase
MQAVTTIGFDIAKSVFQVHGVDTVGQVIIRRQLADIPTVFRDVCFRG